MSGGPFDAVIIGAGVGGLTAAAYLARGGARVAVFEAREIAGGRAESASFGEGFVAPVGAHTLYALDRAMVHDLDLHRHGLAFAERAMPLTILRSNGKHTLLARDGFTSREAVMAHGVEDADSYPLFRRHVQALARRLRSFWLAEALNGERMRVQPISPVFGLPPRHAAQFDRVARMSAAAFLDHWFVSDALKAALAMDVCADGFSPYEAGSALALIWRAAQESGGVQGAVAQMMGGPGALAAALLSAARESGAIIRTRTAVRAIAASRGRAVGVVLDSGEFVAAADILSGLDLEQTALMIPPESWGFGVLTQTAPSVASARMVLGLSALPPFTGLDDRAFRGRMVIAERPEDAAEARAAALLGEMPRHPVVEITVPSVADHSAAPAGRHVLSARVFFLPAQPKDGWPVLRETLRRQVLALLEGFAPGLAERLMAVDVLLPCDMADRYGSREGEDTEVLRKLLTPHAARVTTPLEGLFLCGDNVEPGNALSGRAGRVAARLVRRRMQGGVV